PAANGCFGPMPPSQMFAVNECPFCNNADRVWFEGLGVNTYLGNFNYQQTDGRLPSAMSLSFERSYNSLTAGNYPAGPPPSIHTYNDGLGYGWTHNAALRLTFPNQPEGEPDTVILRAPHGSQL